LGLGLGLGLGSNPPPNPNHACAGSNPHPNPNHACAAGLAATCVTARDCPLLATPEAGWVATFATARNSSATWLEARGTGRGTGRGEGRGRG